MQITLNSEDAVKECFATTLQIDKYLEIRKKVKSAEFDPKNDEEFTRLFDGYYKVRRNDAWRKKYYQIFSECVTDCEQCDFKKILGEIANATEIWKDESGKDKKPNVECSFVSKLLATVNPNLPIWDNFVAVNMGFNEEWNLYKGKPAERIEKASELYEQLCHTYKEYIESDEGKRCIANFRNMLPDRCKDNEDITDARILDWIIVNQR